MKQTKTSLLWLSSWEKANALAKNAIELLDTQRGKDCLRLSEAKHLEKAANALEKADTLLRQMPGASQLYQCEFCGEKLSQKFSHAVIMAIHIKQCKGLDNNEN